MFCFISKAERIEETGNVCTCVNTSTAASYRIERMLCFIYRKFGIKSKFRLHLSVVSLMTFQFHLLKEFVNLREGLEKVQLHKHSREVTQASHARLKNNCKT